MEKHKYYYNREDKHIYRYFAHIGNTYFKTREEYDAYVAEHNLPTKTVKVFRLSKYALKTENFLLGNWVEYAGIAPGTFIHDDRDFSRYTFETVEEVDEFLNYYDAQDFHYCQQCFYDGYEGDEVNSYTYRADRLIEEFSEHTFDPDKENAKFAHFIISYLPNNELREQRLAAHRKQILDIKETTPNARIYIIAQGYNEAEYFVDPQITYLAKYAEPIGAQKARNELLRYFYNSEYEYGIFSDDDAFIVPSATVKNFYKELEENTEKFINAGIDICYSRNMQYSPFTEADVENIENFNHNYVFYYARSSWLCWALLRNFKKAYNKEFYQNEEIDPTQVQGYDDTDFSLTLVHEGMHSFVNPLFQLLLLNSEEYSSTIFNTVDANPLYRVRNIKATYDKWFTKNEDGTYNYDSVRPAWYPNVVLPRAEIVDANLEVTGRQTEHIKTTLAMRKATLKEKNKYFL